MDGDRYLKKLQSPEWKKKRKKILSRDNHRCTCCGSNANLVVHHTFYYQDHPDPWKYPNSSLITLCEDCHHDFHRHHEVPIKPPEGKRRKKCRVLSLAEIQAARGVKTKKRAV